VGEGRNHQAALGTIPANEVFWVREIYRLFVPENKTFTGIAAELDRRGAPFCPFCESHESATPKEVFAIRNLGSSPNGSGWSVTVAPNSRPRLRIEGELARRAEVLHDLMNGVGAHEIIVETSRHDRSLHELEIEEISDILRAYVARIIDLEGDKRVRYVLIFKNHGEEAGAHTISHSISQLMALPITPRAVKTKLMIARAYFALKERCIYCDVLQQELEGRKRLIGENEDFVAFAPFASRFPFEMCVVPKFHSSAFSRIEATQSKKLASCVMCCRSWTKK